MLNSLTIQLSAGSIAFLCYIQFTSSLVIANAELICNTNSWLNYKQEFWKSYNSKREDAFRMELFCKNLQFIIEHNKGNESGTKLKVNHMSDWTQAELKSLDMNLSKLSPRSNRLMSTKRSALARLLQSKKDEQLPSLVDYRFDSRIVGPVELQGDCGSCWAFATTALIEGQQHKWNSSILEVSPLSAQQLVDCIPGFGCEGGWPDVALEHIKRSGGLMTKEAYPYISGLCHSDHKCHYKRLESFPTSELVDKFEILPEGDEQYLKRVVALNGPVISLMHSDYLFKVYDGVSVFSDPYNCAGEGGAELNHAILIVGYGTAASGEDYWIVKNSWGEKWGNGGFGLMARNRNNSCAIASMPIALIV